MSADQAPRMRLREIDEVSSRSHQVKELESTERTPASPTMRSALVTPHEFSQLMELRAALAEVFDLLEGYGPIWYTEDQHNRAFDALTSTDRLLAPTASRSQPHRTLRTHRTSLAEQVHGDRIADVF
jgi:hypothetical protein